MPTDLILGHKPTYNFGIGLNQLSGAAMNLAVKPEFTTTPYRGAIHSFEVSRITSTEDLQESLGIDVKASYGCASFGAGASARFKFAEDQHVHAESLFMTITATVQLADQSIDHVVLTDEAAAMRDNPTTFAQRYGDMFARACTGGGLFVGVLRVETFSEKVAQSIEGELKGTYGAFSADAKTSYKKAIEKYNANAYFEIYSEGGPEIHVGDPTNPLELLDSANNWMAALSRDPGAYSRPYQWTFSPLAIAEGPLPPNAADLELARDVLLTCARRRLSLLDLINRYAWITLHQDNYDWSKSAPPSAFVDALNAAEEALLLVAKAAGLAMDHPDRAAEPRYPDVPQPTPLPVAREGAVQAPKGPPVDWQDMRVKYRVPWQVRDDLIKRIGG